MKLSLYADPGVELGYQIVPGGELPNDTLSVLLEEDLEKA